MYHNELIYVNNSIGIFAGHQHKMIAIKSSFWQSRLIWS